MNKIFENKPRLIFWLGFVLIITILIAGIITLKNSDKVEMDSDVNVIAIVNGKRIYISEYYERLIATNGYGTIDSPPPIDSHLKEPLLEEEAAKLEITYTEQELSNKATKVYPGYNLAEEESEKKIYLNSAKLFVLEDKIKNKVTTWKEGYFLACRYDRYIQDDYNENNEETKISYQKQKEYAINYCKQLYEKSNNGFDFEEELKKIKADPVIGDKVWEPFYMTLGSKFDKESYNPNKIILGTNLFEKIDNIKSKEGFSLVKADSYKNRDELSDPIEGLSAVVFLSGQGNIGQTIDFEGWLEEIINKSNVFRYLERI